MATGTSRRGFAAMDPDKHRAISSLGGKAAHENGTGCEFTPEQAREAGRKGGMAVSADRKHMAKIGRLGGRARGAGGASDKSKPSAPRPDADDAT